MTRRSRGGRPAKGAALVTPPDVLDAQALAQAQAAYARGDSQPLEALCRRALAVDPAHGKASATLCTLLCAQGRFQEARTMMEAALAADPDFGQHHLNLAHCCLHLRDYATALRAARRATELLPGVSKAWVNLSSACYHAQANDEGVRAALRALDLDPCEPVALNNLGTLRKEQGMIRESVQCYRQALALNPENASCHTNLLLAMLYDETVDVGEVVEVAKGYARQFEDAVSTRCLTHDNVPLPERRLRVGFISPDLVSHSVMYFAEPVLMRLPRQHFEVYAYFLLPVGDHVTDRLKSHVDGFRYVPEPDALATARMIHDDRIDILIDLAGHTAKNGLRAMAYKPAPVQITWLGYPGTTGLKGIDWRITDHTADPPGADAHYTEKLVRLPGCFAVYRPHIRYPLHRFDARYQVAASPALRHGHITFGSCNNIAKISEQSVQAWCEVLRQVPGSRMLIEGKDLGREEATRKLRGMFAAGGVDEDRLRFVQRDSANQYLTYHDIDIALDTFPLTGGTTTFDALWMGVPVVSVVGRTFRERLSMTILAHGGFGEDVCATVGQYVARAVALAGDVPALAARRREQRGRMQRSVLMDEARYVDLFGQSLRMVWRQWCRQREPEGVAAQAEPPKGQDVLVSVNGRRITLPAAKAWLAKLDAKVRQPQPQPAEEDLASRLALAQAIFSVVNSCEPLVDTILGHNPSRQHHPLPHDSRP